MKVTTGIDIIEVERIKEAILEMGDSFLNRIYTEKEIEYCNKSEVMKYQHFAARFAAKEAVSKALGTGIGVHCSWRDIEITRSGHGVPGVLLHGKAEIVALKLGINSWRISLTHSKYSAAALVLALK